MNELLPPSEILVVGATGSIGRLVVVEALRAGYRVRALVRDRSRAESALPPQATLVIGDVTKPETLPAAVDGVCGIVFTQGADGAGKAGSRDVSYGAVRNILFALDGKPVRIALMTAIGITNRTTSYNLDTEAHDWKRRSERLVRRSGLSYTIVRPAWFDYNKPDEHRLVLLQGDTRKHGGPEDGVVARQQIAEILVASLGSAEADRKTFELVAEKGPAQADFAPLFSGLDADRDGALDAVRDEDNQPLSEEPEAVGEDLTQIARHVFKAE